MAGILENENIEMTFFYTCDSGIVRKQKKAAKAEPPNRFPPWNAFSLWNASPPTFAFHPYTFVFWWLLSSFITKCTVFCPSHIFITTKNPTHTTITILFATQVSFYCTFYYVFSTTIIPPLYFALNYDLLLPIDTTVSAAHTSSYIPLRPQPTHHGSRPAQCAPP